MNVLELLLFVFMKIAFLLSSSFQLIIFVALSIHVQL